MELSHWKSPTNTLPPPLHSTSLSSPRHSRIFPSYMPATQEVRETPIKLPPKNPKKENQNQGPSQNPIQDVRSQYSSKFPKDLGRNTSFWETHLWQLDVFYSKKWSISETTISQHISVTGRRSKWPKLLWQHGAMQPLSPSSRWWNVSKCSPPDIGSSHKRPVEPWEDDCHQEFVTNNRWYISWVSLWPVIGFLHLPNLL